MKCRRIDMRGRDRGGQAVWSAAMAAAVLTLLPVLSGTRAEDRPAGPAPKTDGRVRAYAVAPGNMGIALQAVREALGREEGILQRPTPSGLVVTGTDDEHRVVEALLRELSAPAPNVRIVVASASHAVSRDARTGATGSGKVAISRDGPKTTYKFRGHARNLMAGQSGLTQQTLTVQSGREGLLQVYEEVPFYERLVWYGTNRLDMTIERDMIREKTGAFLVVQPTVIGRGPLLSITLVPEIRELTGTRRRRIRFARMATTVTARDGQTIRIGGLGETREFYDLFLVGRGAHGDTRSLDITLTPHIMKGAGP